MRAGRFREEGRRIPATVDKVEVYVVTPGSYMPPSERVSQERRWRQAVLAGDERAWQALYDGAFAELLAYALWRAGGRRDWAEDVVQETWLVAVRRLRDFDPEQGAFVAWLRGIAANVIRNQLRQSGTRAQESGARGRESGGRELEAVAPDGRAAAEDAEHVARVLAALPERYESVLRAKYLEQRSVDEIALLWRETPKAIESLLTWARAAFRAAYGLADDQAHGIDNYHEAIREQQP